jgi:hypothetical protein
MTARPTDNRARRVIARDLAADREIEEQKLAQLQAELATAQTFLEASKTFAAALDAYVATFPGGLDYFDPDRQLDDALDLSMQLRRAGIEGLNERIKEARVRIKRAGERKFAS